MHGSAVSNKVIKVGVNFFPVFVVTLKTTSPPKVVEILKKDSCWYVWCQKVPVITTTWKSTKLQLYGNADKLSREKENEYQSMYLFGSKVS